jgi:hypothetical protein
MAINMMIFQKIENLSTLRSSYSTLGHLSPKHPILPEKGHFLKYIHSSFIYNSQKLKKKKTKQTKTKQIKTLMDLAAYVAEDGLVGHQW